MNFVSCLVEPPSMVLGYCSEAMPILLSIGEEGSIMPRDVKPVVSVTLTTSFLQFFNFYIITKEFYTLTSMSITATASKKLFT
jgi:hypothetical protein